MLKPKLFLITVILSVLVLIAGACAQPVPTPTPTPTPTPSGTLKVYVTDAPPREEVTSIMVTVSEIQVHKAVAEQETEQQQSGTENQTQEQEQQQTQLGEGEWLTIKLSDNTITFDLLKIKGVERFVGTSEVEEGKYTQVRLVIDKVQVKLESGDLQDATLPSNELKIVHPFDVIEGETTVLVIDFEADKMVTVTGANKIIVKPVVKLTVRQEESGGQKDGEESEEETTEPASIEVSCDDFISTKHISQKIKVNVGDSLKVVLCSNPSTGFQWSETAEISDQNILEQVDHKLVMPESEPLPPPGTPGQEVWTFSALNKGKSTISLEYSQSWEGGEQGEWTYTLTVTVK